MEQPWKDTARLSRSRLVKLVVLAAVVIVVAAAAGVFAFRGRLAEWFEPRYTATSWLRVAPTQPHLVFRGGGGQEFGPYKRTQIQLLKSEPVLAEALEKPEVVELGVVWRQDDPVAWLGRHLRVGFLGNSEIMEVALTAAEPHQATILLSAIVDAYLEQANQGGRAGVEEQLEGLDRVYAETQGEFRLKTLKLKQMLQQLPPAERKAATSPELEMLRSEVRHLEGLLDKLADRRMKLGVELNAPPRVTLIRPATLPPGRQ